jgi:RNA polymerase sigma-70 factor (ECF subfamily)
MARDNATFRRWPCRLSRNFSIAYRLVLDVPSELLNACRSGDRDAFGRLFDICRDRVYALAYGIANDRSVAADVSQEVFMKLLTRLPQFEGRASFTTWLYRIVVNTAVDHQRRTRRVVSLPEGLPDGTRLDDDYDRRQRQIRVERAVQALPARLRSPLVLRHIEGLTYGEIAAVLGISMGTVASRLSRAHARLARELEGEV